MWMVGDQMLHADARLNRTAYHEPSCDRACMPYALSNCMLLCGAMEACFCVTLLPLQGQNQGSSHCAVRTVQGL